MMYHVFSFGGALFYLNSCIRINKKNIVLGPVKIYINFHCILLLANY